MLLTDESPRLTGFLRSKWAFSPGLMAITMVMPFLGVLSRLESLIPNTTFLTGAIASVVPSLCGFLFFLVIGPQGERRLTSSAPPVIRVLLWALTGLVVAVVVVVVRTLITGKLVIYPSNSVLIIVIITVTMSLLVLGTYRLNLLGSLLLLAQSNENESRQLYEMQQESAVKQVRTLTETIDRELGEELQRINVKVTQLEDISDSVDLREVLASIQKYSESSVRSVSHKLSAGTTIQLLDPSFVGIGSPIRWRGRGGIWNLLLSSKVSVSLVAVGTLFLFIRYSTVGCFVPLSLSLGCFAALFLVPIWISQTAPLQKPPRALILGLVFFISGYAIFQFLMQATPECDPTDTLALQILNAIFALIALLALLVLFEAGRRTAADTQALRESSEQIRMATLNNRRNFNATRVRLAQVLHGAVQGRLAVISMTIVQFLDARDSGLNPSLNDLKKRVNFLIGEVNLELTTLMSDANTPQLALSDYLDDMVSQWRGLMEIGYEVEPDVLGGYGVAEYTNISLQEILTSAITNAHLHGRADRVDIQIDRDQNFPEHLLISVRDNGIGPPDNIVPGMGLGCVIEWGGEWKLSPRIEGGSQLLVTLPNT